MYESLLKHGKFVVDQTIYQTVRTVGLMPLVINISLTV